MKTLANPISSGTASFQGFARSGYSLYSSFEELQKFLSQLGTLPIPSAALEELNELMASDWRYVFKVEGQPEFHQNCVQVFSLYKALFKKISNGCA